MVPRNSTPGGFAYIWQSKWIRIIVIKTERTQIHFLSDVFVAATSLDLKVPNDELWETRDTLYRDSEGQRVTLQDATLFLSTMQ